LPAGSG